MAFSLLIQIYSIFNLLLFLSILFYICLTLNLVLKRQTGMVLLSWMKLDLFRRFFVRISSFCCVRWFGMLEIFSAWSMTFVSLLWLSGGNWYRGQLSVSHLLAVLQPGHLYYKYQKRVGDKMLPCGTAWHKTKTKEYLPALLVEQVGSNPVQHVACDHTLGASRSSHLSRLYRKPRQDLLCDSCVCFFERLGDEYFSWQYVQPMLRYVTGSGITFMRLYSIFNLQLFLSKCSVL